MESRSSEATAYDVWADHYDLTEGDRGPIIAFYTSLIDDQTRAILELGCGTGAIASAMAPRLRHVNGENGARVIGIDGSHGMLKVARARDTSVQWLFGDIRSPPVQGPFDLVFCCFNTLQLLLRDQDLAQTFAAARELLTTNGKFAFDVFQPNLGYLGSARTNRLIRTIAADDGNQMELREDTAYDADTRILTLNWRVSKQEGKDKAPVAQTVYRMRQYFPAEIGRLLGDAGLVVHEHYGDFDRSPFAADSKKQIFVCGRN